MLGDVIRVCMARKILVQLSTDMHEFEKYSRGATKYTRVTRTRASSLNRAVPYIGTYYRIRGLFGGDFNLAVWQITSESPNLNRAILKAIF